MNKSKLYFNIITFFIGVLLLRQLPAQNLPERVISLQSKAEQIAKSHPDSAFHLLYQAEEEAPKGKVKAVKTINDWLRARTMYLHKDYDSTIHYTDLAITSGIEIQDFKTLSSVYNLLGVLTKRQGSFNESLNHYSKSLKYARAAQDSLTWAKALQNLGNVHRQMGQADSALHYYEVSISIKEQLKDPLSTAKTILNLGNYYFSSGQFKKAIEYYNRAFPFYQQADYAEGIARLNNNIGAAYQELGFKILSTEYYIKSLSICDSLGIIELKINSLMNLASVLKDQGKSLEAKSYYLRALEGQKETEDNSIKAKLYLNIADLQEGNDEWTEALETYGNAAKIYSDQQMSKGLSETYHGLARTYAGLGNKKLAEKYFQLCLELKSEIGDDLNMGKALTSLAVFQYENGYYDKARVNYRKGLELARKFEFPKLSRANLLGLSEVYEALGNPAKALSYRLQYETVKDSLDDLEKSRQIAELQEQYESVQKDKQISDLALKNSVANAEIERNEAIAEKEQARKTTYLITAIALFILASVIFIYYRQRLSIARLKEEEEQAAHKRNIESLLEEQRTKNLEARIAGEEQERQRLAKDLHDHLGSILATVKVNLQGIFERENTFKDNEQVQTVNTLVDKACNDVRGIAHNLHMGISESFGLTSALNDLAASVSGANGIKVDFTAANCTERFDINLEIFVYRMVQEFLSNALRHSGANLISIQLTCLDDLISIIVEDNGKGFEDHRSTQSNGIGLKNLTSRIEDFDGEISIDSTPGKGTSILVDLPLTTQPEIA